VYYHHEYYYGDKGPSKYVHYLTKSRRKGVPITEKYNSLQELNKVYKLQKAVKQKRQQNQK